MNCLTDLLNKYPPYLELLRALKEKEGSVYLHGLNKNCIPHFLFALHTSTSQNLVVIVEDEMRARVLQEGLVDFMSEIVQLYPGKEISFHNIRSLEDQREKERIAVMMKLLSRQKMILITTLDALQKKISLPKWFQKKIRIIRRNDIIDIIQLSEELRQLKYDRVNIVESCGQYAIRGGIIDIFPVYADQPVRLELFDDEIDSMRHFQVEDQRSVNNIDQVVISPAKELLFTSKDVNGILKGLKKDLETIQKHPTFGMNLDKTKEKFLTLIDQLENEMTIANTDLLSPYIKRGNYGTILDYFDKDTIVFLEDLTRLYDKNSDKQKMFMEQFTYQLEQGEVLSSHEHIPISFQEIMIGLKNFSMINVTQLMKRTRLLQPKTILTFETLEVDHYNRNFFVLKDSLQANLDRGFGILLFAGSTEKAQSLTAYLQQESLPAIYRDDLSCHLKSGQIIVSHLTTAGGFIYPTLKRMVISNREIYGSVKRHPAKKKKRSTKDILNYSDLMVGDFIVHENHGIGQYKGIEQITVQGVKKDYLVIQYKGNDKLFIPTEQMNFIQKYIGAESYKPRLNKLSGTDWAKTKQRAKKALQELAMDLVQLYAKRSQVQGYAFSKDTEWQREFEDSFIYEETYSQLRSLEEIKKDMESSKPMDRLLCGDVGYGKTEVAIRAGFKAIMDGKQVAFLVPTTILAQQHYLTIQERFKSYPIKTEMISRFRTPRQQRQILSDVSKGFVDLLVGTHRLLSKDLRFRDLGLLIVDEEQRFGVRHKDRLKALKENIDVLTLSATPIPRTLQMSLIGIRDMSILDEPPEERYPVTTYVLEYQESVVREAILAEINRGGQIYFVYNRIQDIEEMELRLQNLVPTAKIVIGHGQMPENQLEDIMIAFINGEFDILLCTTIIETGLDIQNVNTMIVYDADRLGLSQLYQLKGRIGRGDRTSFAYFTYGKNKVLTEIAEKRLMAIKDFTEFGSGFKIAMRDLELRGAGNLLGESQHGHIEAIGYDLYVKFLEETIRELKGEVIVNKKEVTLDLKVDGYIPNDYIPDASAKIEMYQRIAVIESEKDYQELVDELIDRYGDIPKSVQNIMQIAFMKTMAVSIGFTAICESRQALQFYYSPLGYFTVTDIQYLQENYGGHLEYDFTQTPSIRLIYQQDRLKEGIEFLKVVQILKSKKINKKIEGNGSEIY